MGDIKEVKAGYSWAHLGLLVIGAFLTAAVGYGFNEYTRDRKVLEVTMRSSGNLASVPIAAASNLEVVLQTPAGKEPIKSLVRYDVRISNRSEQGADDFNVFLEVPSSIELVETPTITTVPTELRNAIVTKTTRLPSGNYQVTVNLLNPSQSITIGYLGFSRTEFVTGTTPLSVAVAKKDWTYRNVADEAASDSWSRLWIFAIYLVALLVGVGTYFGIRHDIREQKKTVAQFDSIREAIDALATERDALARERDELRERLSSPAHKAEALQH